jgi:DNA-binding SARP family transcriptional activator
MAVNTILSIRLLGGFQIANGQEPATNLERARRQELLAYLLLHHGRSIPRQQLAFPFWPDSSEKQALTNLRNLWYGLRRADAPCRLDAAE